MYFSEELKYAQKNGYKINVRWGYKFNRVKDVFSEYVNKLYNMKSKPSNITQKLLAKSLLNNLLGRFGIYLDKPITEIMNENKLREVFLIHKVT